VNEIIRRESAEVSFNLSRANREGCRMTYAITWAEWEGHADASIRPHAA
jgi:hypothetical protein